MEMLLSCRWKRRRKEKEKTGTRHSPSLTLKMNNDWIGNSSKSPDGLKRKPKQRALMLGFPFGNLGAE
jgi:hypothetical protein